MKSVNRFVVRAVLAAVILSGPASLAMAQAAPQAVPATHAISKERLDRVKQMMQAYVDQGRIAGAVVQIQQDGREVYSAAVGWRDKEAKSPIAKDSIFRIASQTKALTSVAIMMLSEDGKLLLNDPVGKYLPEWQKTTVAVKAADGSFTTVPAKRPITIRDLLTHTSGISYGSGAGEKAWKDAGITGWYFADRKEPVSAVVARMGALPMAAQPGEAFVYGYSTDILGVIVEKVSGKTLDAFLAERLIQPLGMKDTSFYLPRDKTARLATVYAAGEGGVKPAPASGQGAYLDGPRIAFSGGAGLLSTAPDYSRFLEMLRRGGEIDGRRYLSRKSVELMTSNHLNIPYDPGKGFGLGFSIREDVGKAGEPGSKGEFAWGGAYHSTYWVDPVEGLTVVYMTQLLPSGDVDDHGKLRTLIYQAVE